MTATRSYDDPCGIARALDVIGDRWALLVVRELIFGPKRFLQLREDLRTISPNVLSQRLRDMEDAGVVRRRVLDPPASVPVYELTDRGRALEPVLLELGRWGSQQTLTVPGELTADALLVALKTVFNPQAAAVGTYGLNLGGNWFRVVVAGDSIDIRRSRATEPSVEFTTDVATLRSVVFGREPLDAAEADGRMLVHGDRDLARRFTRMFPVGFASANAGARGADFVGGSSRRST